MRITTYKELPKMDRRLLDAAERVMSNSYNPYSHFYVGSAVLAGNGQIIPGTNVENAAYGSTICAERTAIVSANARGIRVFNKMALITKGEDFDVEQVFGPCGACRQMIYESSQLSGTDLELILSNTKKTKIVIATINELLPLAFGPNDLGVDIKRYRT